MRVVPARLLLALVPVLVVVLIGLERAPSAAGQPRPGPAPATERRQPLRPRQALSSFVLEPGYRIDLVAAEPLVEDPVAITFDARGRLYVVENRGYPDPLEGEPPEPPRGAVARLTDRNGDGRYDTRTEFATRLAYPNGIAAWGGGVFVTDAPDLLYLEDTDDDGVADVRRTVLTGFNATRTAQIRFSHPTVGPDGWIYLTSGLNGGRVTSPAHPERPAVAFTSSDSRFDPRTGAFELVGGQGQYGLTFDDDGHRFICANRHPVWHVVIEPRHLQRNPALAFADTVHEVSTVGAEAAVWPITRDLTTASFHPTLIATPHAGTFTSASGAHVHRGDALPAGHGGSIFVAESAQNLVQRQVREDFGPTFRSRPARTGVEFLASRDSWFRPVFLTNGPDGALYVVDMYRKDIDHPAYVPEESRRLFDFTAGRGMGRIYRVAAKDRPPVGMAVDLMHASDAELVARLGHANGWWRDTAQRGLVERGGTTAVTLLREALASPSRFARLHALWTLDALDAVTDADIQTLLRDGDGAVREHAARLAERRLATSAALLDAVLPLVDDVSPRVRLQVALALGASHDARAVAGLAAIARKDGADRWVRAAILAGLHERALPFLDAFESAAAPASETAAVMQDVARLVAATESPARCVELIARLSDPRRELQWQSAALSGMAEGLRARGLGSATRTALLAVVASDVPAAATAKANLAVQFARAGETARLEGAPVAQRLSAIELLGHAEWSLAGPTLLSLLQPRESSPVQSAAVRALAQLRDRRAASGLLETERWAAYTPRLREAVLTALLSDDRTTPAVLDAVAAGHLSSSALGGSRVRRLTEHRDASVRERARRLLGDGAPASAAQQAYARLREPVMAAAGHVMRGTHQFVTHCAACHTFAGQGGTVGPDLSGVGNQPVDALLLHVLVPDAEITPGYEAYTVQTRDGQTVFGRVESETAASLRVRDGAGTVHDILRTSVASITASPNSLMPATFHEVLSASDLADLIGYLKRPRASR